MALQDVCEFIVDCLHHTAPIQEEGYPSIRTPNIGKGRLLLNGVNRVSEETYQIWTQRAVPQPDDLILAREAPAGNIAIVKDGEKVCLGQRTVHLRPDKNIVDPDFLCYFLLAPPQQGKLLAGETGATAKHVNMADIRRLELCGLPDIATQKAAGSTLAAYDDLTENNRRRMALLEESVRLLYQEWFVRLRFPGHEHTRVVDGVPEGWERAPFSVLANFVNGYPFKPSELGTEGFPIVKIPELRGGVSDKTPRNDGENIPEKYFLKDSDLLFSWSGTLLIDFWFDGTAILNQHLFRVEPNLSCSPEFLCLALREALPQFANQSVGATMKHIRKSALTTVTTLLPPSSLLQQFDEVASLIYPQILNLRQQNQKLRAARDLLLPRLMSGEIVV